MTLAPALLDLAVSLHHNPGVYALLLGSGLSRAAGVPTAWGIVRDLERQLAASAGVTPLPEGDALDAWYCTTYGEGPDYSAVVARIEPTPAGQRNLLRGYFDQTPEDREQGLKTPSRAHHAIARLCEAGLLRMIITTNFDRLMEDALQEVGIRPTVISNAQEITAAPPYAHGGVFLLKLHGDYLKDDVRNSNADLERYPDALQAYLDRIIDEFGLIICGWSGESDHALRRTIGQTPNRRYPLVWSAYPAPTPVADELVAARAGRLVRGLDADTFFEQLEGRVLALRDLAWTPPREGLALAAEVKRDLAHPERDDVRLTDLLERVCDDLHAALRVPHAWEAKQALPQALEWAANVTAPLIHVAGALLKYDRTGHWTPRLRDALLRIDFDVNLTLPLKSDFAVQVTRIPLRLLAVTLAGLAAVYDRVELLTWLKEDLYRRPYSQHYAPVELLIRSCNVGEIRRQPLEDWIVEQAQDIARPYFPPATADEDLRVGELLLGLLTLDLTLDGRVLPLDAFVLPGTYLYALELPKAQDRLRRLFGANGERITRLTDHDAALLFPKFDEVASRGRNAWYGQGKGALADLLPHIVDP
ncbi:Sir2-like deacetylase (plasmid) [Deinococcus geothermalis DSM 11300]|uniref:Sir2-like deacetylase n=1 Tax=Deinococcus geothermalis (strain DSM 11300 / CIP 105573 / AG-3a) TaxID=319795 RepID=A8ZR72_DEIGD|nr:SIR2 family protein [Deinococcus geothermalis]ABW34981.1 Sir2-like deacetylase [Deinococcus geothermalis DSM 11300]